MSRPHHGSFGGGRGTALSTVSVYRTALALDRRPIGPLVTGHQTIGQENHEQEESTATRVHLRRRTRVHRLPTSAALARGFTIHGVEISQEVVDTINAGETHIVEPELDLPVRAAVDSDH